jgi:hypothetical protein
MSQSVLSDKFVSMGGNASAFVQDAHDLEE